MTAYKLLALDLDDTLLRTDLTISGRTCNFIKKLAAKGIIVVITTGRVPKAMEKFVKMLGLNKTAGYMICGNGTLILNTKTKEVLNDIKIPLKTALAAFDLIDAEEFSAQIYDEDRIFVSRRNEFSDADHKLTGMRQVVPPDFHSLLAEKGANKIVIPADPMLLKPLEEILRNVMGRKITLFTSKPYYLEILPPDCDKGTALRWIAEKLNIKKEEVIAFGDSMNDDSMLRWAGIGVVMCNGHEHLKEISRFITRFSNDEDGVVDFLETNRLFTDNPAPGFEIQSENQTEIQSEFQNESQNASQNTSQSEG